MKLITTFPTRISSIPEKPVVNTAICIVLISFLFMISGCHYYKVTTRTIDESSTVLYEILKELYPEKTYPRDRYPEGNLEKMLWMEHEFYIIDSQGHWFLKDPWVKGDTLYARATKNPLPIEDIPGTRTYKSGKKMEDLEKSGIIDRVKLYVDTLQFLKSDTALVPLASIQEWDYYAPDTRHEVGLILVLIGGLALTTMIILTGVAIANFEPSSTSSCPYIFTYAGDTCHFEGEIFGGAIFRSLERDDYLPLNTDHIRPGADYKVKMVNMLQEIQYINFAELVLVDHDTNVRAYMDKYGEVQTVNEPIRPYSAYDSGGKDVLDLISAPDHATYNFNEDPDTSVSCMNHIDLVFTSQTTVDRCKILVKGHNSLWIDLLTSEMFETLGKKHPLFLRLMDRKSSEKQNEWLLSQGLPLRVYILKEQEWQFADYFDIVGPIAAKEMVLPLNVRDAWSEDRSGPAPQYNLHIRLVAGYNFWELDYAAIDFTVNQQVEKTIVRPVQVTDQDSVDVTALLRDDDRRYLVQWNTGDEAMMHFTLPDYSDPPGSIFLHAKGYYHQVVGKSGQSNLAYMWSFLKPGRLSEYSYENYLEFQEFLAGNE